MNNTNEDEFLSTDFYFSAYLISAGITLLATEKNDRGLTTFIFAGKTTCFKLKKDYFGLNAEVSPLVYANSIKMLKSILHSA